MEKQIEAVGVFNHTKITLEDAEILSRSVFKGINVNNVTLTCYGEFSTDAIADFIARVKKHTLMFMIQESWDDGMKVTFVTSIPWEQFLHLAYHQRDICQRVHNCILYIFND